MENHIGSDLYIIDISDDEEAYYGSFDIVGNSNSYSDHAWNRPEK